MRELFQSSHFSSRTQVHGREGIYFHYDLPLFILYEKYVVLRRIFPSYTLYHDVLKANFSIEVCYLVGGLWGKPQNSWWAPLTPHCTFMFLSYEMIMEENKCLGENFLLLVLF